MLTAFQKESVENAYDRLEFLTSIYNQVNLGVKIVFLSLYFCRGLTDKEQTKSIQYLTGQGSPRRGLSV